MSAVLPGGGDRHAATGDRQAAAPGPWRLAARRLRRHRTGMAAALVVLAYLLMIVASALGWIASDWDRQLAASFAPPSWLAGTSTGAARSAANTANPLPGTALRGGGSGVAAAVAVPGVTDPIADWMAQARERAATRAEPAAVPHDAGLLLGADRWGRSVALKLVKGAETSVLVGLAAALLATLIGSLLGALAGYLGGWVDALVDWLYGVFTAIPYLLLVFAIAAVLRQRGATTVVLILGITGWTPVYRLVRAEYLRQQGRDYVLAARALGVSHLRRMFVHILPNAAHVVLVQLSQGVVNFIKAEVILSFLGFGVPVDVVSWGSMLGEAASELVLGKWWQMAAAGTAMAVLVTAFAMFTDALRDVLDPRLH